MSSEKSRRLFRSTTAPDSGKRQTSPPTPLRSLTSSPQQGDLDQDQQQHASIKRSTSALARFTRSMSKLTSRRRRNDSELPDIAANVDNNDSQDTTATEIRRLETMPARTKRNDQGDDIAEFTLPRSMSVVAQRRATDANKTDKSMDKNNKTPQVTEFLKVVPDMLEVDAQLKNVSEVLKNAERIVTMADTQNSNSDLRGITIFPWTTQQHRQSTIAIRSTSSHHWRRHMDALQSCIAEHRFTDALAHWQILMKPSRGGGMQCDDDKVAVHWAVEKEKSEIGLELATVLLYTLSKHPFDRQVASTYIQLARSADAGTDSDIDSSDGSTTATGVVIKTILNDAIRPKLRDSMENISLNYYQRPSSSVSSAAASSGAVGERSFLDLASALGQSLAVGILEAKRAVEPYQSSEAVFSYWIAGEISFGCDVLRRTVIQPRAAPAGLTVAVACAQAFLEYCDGLETVLEFPVGSIARQYVWDAIEPVVQRRSVQLCDIVRKWHALSAKATTHLDQIPDGPFNNIPWDSLIEVFPSVRKLLAEVHSMATAIAPIASPLAIASIRDVTTNAFAAFTHAVTSALCTDLNTKKDGKKTYIASSKSAEAAMEVATRLVESKLAEATRAVSVLGWGPAVDAVAVVKALEGMAVTLGMDTTIEVSNSC